MTAKRFTQSEINEITNKIYVDYLNVFHNGKMEYRDLALIENVITRVQMALDLKEVDE